MPARQPELCSSADRADATTANVLRHVCLVPLHLIATTGKLHTPCSQKIYILYQHNH
jgi:hypothetical protein